LALAVIWRWRWLVLAQRLQGAGFLAGAVDFGWGGGCFLAVRRSIFSRLWSIFSRLRLFLAACGYF
jgi:hypothetical protein